MPIFLTRIATHVAQRFDGHLLVLPVLFVANGAAARGDDVRIEDVQLNALPKGLLLEFPVDRVFQL